MRVCSIFKRISAQYLILMQLLQKHREIAGILKYMLKGLWSGLEEFWYDDCH